MDYIQGFDRKQEILFPAKIDDYIGDENLVHFIEAFVALLDLIELGFTHAQVNTTGRPSYNPADLLKLCYVRAVPTLRNVCLSHITISASSISDLSQGCLNRS
jgi:transposase